MKVAVDGDEGCRGRVQEEGGVSGLGGRGGGGRVEWGGGEVRGVVSGTSRLTCFRCGWSSEVCASGVLGAAGGGAGDPQIHLHFSMGEPEWG